MAHYYTDAPCLVAAVWKWQEGKENGNLKTEIQTENRAPQLVQ